jgi:hypothetical protein
MSRKPSAPADEIWGEFLEFASAFGGTEFSLALSQRLGLEGLATLRYRARRGCAVAAKELANRGLGQPELPVSLKAQAMNSPEEVRQAMRDIYRAQGMDEDTALARVAELEPGGG